MESPCVQICKLIDSICIGCYRTTEDTGPFSNAPAIAPIDVATAGTTFVKSISLTWTPGETKNDMIFAPSLRD